MNSFVALMTSWGISVADAVKSEPRKATIGYSVQTKTPSTVNEEAPTFPPTSVKFQNYEYLAPDQSTPTDGPGPKGDNNVLLYLEMTQNLDFPKEPLTYSGNFVTAGMDGTICISRDVFFDSYLLRHTPSFLLNALNQSVYGWIVQSRNVSANQEYPDPEKNLKVGPGSDQDSTPEFFAFKPVDGSNTKWNWTPSDYTIDQPKLVKLEYWGR